ncbi:MAG: c-type cytochrome [Rhodospirillaceae bacterium]|nr:c-type cytochrome [Rhodospirillaceae bacterium]
MPPSGRRSALRGQGLPMALRAVLIAGAVFAVPALADVLDITRPTTDFSRPERYENNPGGATTYRGTVTHNAFSQPSANLGFGDRATFNIGNSIFRRVWVSAPSSTQASDGLGPLYNARACQRCHLKDGRGHPPEGNYPDDTAVSMLMRLSIPPESEADHALLDSGRAATLPDPVYGGQLQDLAIQGHAIEGRIHTAWEEMPVALADGEIVSLRRPTYSITDFGYGAPHPGLMMSVRVAQPMIGLGLLELISEDDILANADPDDSDGDGISGRPNRVWSVADDRLMLGRFGWKANQPTLMQQIAAAFSGDVGLSSPLFPDAWGECTDAQAACRGAIHGDSPQYEGLEIPSDLMDALLFYNRNLAVPARRESDDPQVLAGKQLFYETGCIGCHVPKYVTLTDETMPAQSHQLIWPYTDLLLHDMGDGLADNRPDGLATGSEWRTPPLWGIGLTEVVSGHTYFLHDGRARSLTEAILWHGGEAQAMRDAFAAMGREEREAMLAFLRSL